MANTFQKPNNCSCVYDCDKFTQEDTEKLYEYYTALAKADQSNTFSKYILIEKNSKKRARSGKRIKFYFYLPTSDGLVMPVCQKMFCHALHLSKTEMQRLKDISYDQRQAKGDSRHNGNTAVINEKKNLIPEGDKTSAEYHREILIKTVDVILLLLLSDDEEERRDWDYGKALEKVDIAKLTEIVTKTKATTAASDSEAPNEPNTSCDNETATCSNEATAEEVQALASESDIIEMQLTARATALASAIATAVAAILSEKKAKLQADGVAAALEDEQTTSYNAAAVQVAKQEELIESGYDFKSDDQLEMTTTAKAMRVAVTKLIAAIGAKITSAAIDITTEEEAKLSQAITALKEFNNRAESKGTVNETSTTTTTSDSNTTAAAEQADEQQQITPEQLADALECLVLDEYIAAAKEAATAEGPSTTTHDYSDNDSEIANDPTATTDNAATAIAEKEESNVIRYIPPETAVDDDENELSFTEAQLAQTEDDMLDNATISVQELTILQQMLTHKNLFTM